MEEQQERYPLVLYAAKSSDEKERKLSSSGGLFPQLAQQTLAKGGVVFGAVFNSEWKVVQRWIDNSDDLPLLQGSKYVQSEIGDTFREAKQFLDSGHDVLFSGTPCQIAGLKHFLRKEYTQLLTVDIVCHGVPSPMVWRDYLKSFRRPITDVKFRVKEDKVNRYLVIKSEDEILCNEIGATNSYIQGFLKDIYLRPSCYH